MSTGIPGSGQESRPLHVQTEWRGNLLSEGRSICPYTGHSSSGCCGSGSKEHFQDQSVAWVNGRSTIRAQSSSSPLSECAEYEKLTQTFSPVAALVPDPIYFEVSTSNCDRITPLIVNGEKTRHGEFPHMAAIAYKVHSEVEDQHEDPSASFKFICGGVLISAEFVLTAAHCTNVFG